VEALDGRGFSAKTKQRAAPILAQAPEGGQACGSDFQANYAF
jgi:hypothetical protein